MDTLSRREVLATLRGRLESQAYLFDDPQTYLAGIDDTLHAIAEVVAVRRKQAQTKVLTAV